MKRNARKGFTLIEVLLVVMILAMLAAFAVPRIMQAGDKAKVDIARSDVGPSGRIAMGLDMFKLYVGRYPTTEEGLGALVVKPSTRICKVCFAAFRARRSSALKCCRPSTSILRATTCLTASA